MQHQLRRAADSRSPLYLLASVGAGGLAVTFFMYLLFWSPHPGQPVPVFEDIVAAWSGAPPELAAAIAVALLGIAVFGVINLSLLASNLRRVAGFQRSGTGLALRTTNAEKQMMAMPLAIAMSLTVAFILGMVFVASLWSVVEYHRSRWLRAHWFNEHCMACTWVVGSIARLARPRGAAPI
ncbi:MAG: hypothetical protein AAFP13_01665 [Pseudomonadota bacterium]